ncbi:MAG: hypothetical protein GF350_04715 [Chitinivibrionales bacterium]|nr:hypothetical protein [Chitinivibrionales bacterium]
MENHFISDRVARVPAHFSGRNGRIVSHIAACIVLLFVSAFSRGIHHPAGIFSNSFIFGLNFDPSFTLNVGYARVFHIGENEWPLTLSADFATPMMLSSGRNYIGEIGTMVPVYQFKKVKVVNALTVRNMRQENWAAVAYNFTLEEGILPGFYHEDFYIAAEASFAWFLFAHYAHSDKYRDTVYEDVVDGWYRSTGGKFDFGVRGGIIFLQKWGVNIRGGIRVDELFRITYSGAPVYVNFGVSYAW